MVKLDTPELLDSLEFFKDGYHVLDIGCGQAFMAKYLRKKNKEIWYHGFDVSLGNIKHCRNLFINEIRYKFVFLPFKSDTYSPQGELSAESFTLKFPDSSVDSVICHSLFTHLDTEPIARRYMSEIKRVLKDGGKLWTTWFSNPPNDVSDGTRRTVYNYDFIEEMLEEFESIYWNGGLTTSYHDQLEIACVKR